jgi:zinc transporter ZupT
MQEHTFLFVVAASSLACLVTMIGIFVINKYAAWGNRHIAYFISFAAGVLISVSIMHIIPKAITMHPIAPIFVLIGFFGMYLINRLMKLYVCGEKECTDLTLGIIPMIGIGLHSFIDGVIYSVTFNVDIFTGALAAVGMVLHEFPEGIVTFLLLERAGFSRKRSLLFAFLAAALTTPLGTLISYPFIDAIDQSMLGILLALSSGALVYVGATHLLPTVEKESARYTVLSLLSGILIAVIIVLTKG